ncbi:MAG: SDR family NAD(P)-dependent oxidoreductase [Vicinamibacterales bacterium]
MQTLVIVGTGPGLGLSIARRFGREGFRVGLIARRQTVLDECAGRLVSEGIEAAAFTADAAQPDQLTAALTQAERRLGAIDALEFSPMPFTSMPTFTAAGTTVEDLMHHIRVQTIGAMVAARHVLPGMIERKRGTLIFTTGISAVMPLPLLTPVGMAMSAVRNYARCLHQELAPTGVYAGTVSIGTGIRPGTPGDPDIIAELYWQLHVTRDRADVIFPDRGTPPA